VGSVLEEGVKKKKADEGCELSTTICAWGETCGRRRKSRGEALSWRRAERCLALKDQNEKLVSPFW